MKCKPHQLKLAQQVGLTVPQTTISNNQVSVGKLFKRVDHGRVIFKSLTPLNLPPDKILLTTEITKEFPSVSRSGITQCPAIYQELVEREIRITNHCYRLRSVCCPHCFTDRYSTRRKIAWIGEDARTKMSFTVKSRY